MTPTSMPRLSKLGVVPKVLAGVTAVLSLAFAIRQASVYVADHRHRQQRVAELVAIAKVQRESHDYRAAWRSLGDAASLDARNATVQTTREDLAFDWLQNARAPQGTTLGAIGDSVAVVLTRGIVTAQGTRKADLIAHLGWADFLRWRDGQQQLDPAARYHQALGVDPRNVYAHAMFGHWLLWRNSDSLAEAKRHFAAALESGRERRFARDLELAAFGNRSSDDLELLRVTGDMRASGDSVSEAARNKFWGTYFFLLNSGFSRSAPGVRHDPGGESAPDVPLAVRDVLIPEGQGAILHLLFGAARGSGRRSRTSAGQLPCRARTGNGDVVLPSACCRRSHRQAFAAALTLR